MVGSREVGGLEQSRQTINSQFCGKGDSTFGMLKVSKLMYKNGIEVCVHINQSQVTIVWNTRGTGYIYLCYGRRGCGRENDGRTNNDRKKT